MGDPVGVTTGVNYEVVASRVRVLGELVNEFLDDVHPALLSTRNGQDTSRWTGLPQCETFRQQYMASIDASDIALRAVWNDIESLALNLKASADAMSTLDQSVRDSLEALLTRIQSERPTEYSGYTPFGVPVEVYYNLTGDYSPGSGTAITGDVGQVGQDGV